jgi:hypothetical protein
MPDSSDPTHKKKYHDQKKYCEWQSNIVLSSDAPFSVSELTAFVLGGRPGAFFFLLVIATGLLLLSTSEKTAPPQMKNAFYVSRAKNKKNRLDSKLITHEKLR